MEGGVVFRGREGVFEYFDLQAETWESMIAEPVELRDLGAFVLVKVHLQAVGRASGIPVDLISWNLFKLRGGTAVSGHVYTSEAEALEAVGLRE